MSNSPRFVAWSGLALVLAGAASVYFLCIREKDVSAPSESGVRSAESPRPGQNAPRSQDTHGKGDVPPPEPVAPEPRETPTGLPDREGTPERVVVEDEVEPDFVLEDLAELAETTVADLRAKGFPLIMAPRKRALAQTVAQTTEEVVADLGNNMVTYYCRLHLNTAAGQDEMFHYHAVIPGYIKVLRLIEEGREERQRVLPLLRDAIDTCMQSYDRSSKEWDSEFYKWVVTKQRSAPSIRDGDEFYARHRRYQDPLNEFERLNQVIYFSFYILGGLDALEPGRLAKWVGKDRAWRYRCLDMDVWLVDCYSRQEGIPSAFRSSHAELTAGLQISGKTVTQSRWNALWDVHFPLLKVRGVDTSDIPTIDVPMIPPRLPEELTKERKEQIISNFLAHARTG